MDEILLECISAYQNNRYFDPNFGFEEILRPFYELKVHLAKKGYDLKTIDLSKTPLDAKAIVSLELPREPSRPFFKLPTSQLSQKLYCILYEPPSVRLDNYDKSKHGMYKRLFTWNDDMVDNKKYFKFQYYIPFFDKEKIEVKKAPFEEKNLLCLVSSNKYSYHKDQLYNERIKAIRFMEKNHPKEFSLFGGDWDMPVFHSYLAEKYYLNNFHKILSRVKKAAKINSLGNWQFPSWNGRIDSKIDTMQNYKFSFCYENQTNIKGYISEKIFDSFRAGCVPVYYGADNITNFVPKNCFIDFRDFDSYEQLYSHLNSMGEKIYQNYIKNIEKYLNSKQSYPFKIDSLISTFEQVLEL